ncbi:hypothetical protein [Halalkaliarchaeum desulfuricum]|nr:hypothetical protein [Halalkaliarchaeum desulfuricum]
MAEKLDTTVSYWTEYVMYKGSERELHFPLAVCVSYKQGNRGKHGLLVRAYVACDLADVRRKKSKLSTSTAQPSRQPSGRCAKRVRVRIQLIRPFGCCSSS